MYDLTLILLAAGNSTRFKDKANFKKQWLRVGNQPLWKVVVKNFKKKYNFKEIIIACSSNELEYMKLHCNDKNIKFVIGGDERADSLKNALELVTTEFVLVSDVARAKISKRVIKSLVENADKFDCVTPYLNVVDTTYLGNKQIEREEVKLIQTPQLSKTSLLLKALNLKDKFSDDSSAIKAVGGKIGFVKGSKKALKITTINDLKSFKFKSPSKDIFSGNGFDVHKFDENKKDIVLCGVKIPYEKGFIAHSDGDVAIHALIDAIFGAVSLKDIGELYPDNDEKFKGIDSRLLLKDAYQRVSDFGFEIINVDITIIAQKPKLKNYKDDMQRSIAQILHLPNFRVNIKATTSEELGFTGRGEGVAVISNANLKYFNWKKL